jgi:ribosomal protein S18 acetylase RimI-like enzyme
MNLKIRDAIFTDESFLREMLFQAIFVEKGELSPARSILNEPAIARYVDGWGQEGDIGLIAELNENPVGAIWTRLFSEKNRGFGWVDVKTPELSMAVEFQNRSQGIGTKLLQELLTRQSFYKQISLSVSPNNPVVRLYRRVGFVEIGKSGTSITMLRTIGEQ